MATRKARASSTAAIDGADSDEQGHAADGTPLLCVTTTMVRTSPTAATNGADSCDQGRMPMVLLQKQYKPTPAFVSIKSSSDYHRLGMQPRHM